MNEDNIIKQVRIGRNKVWLKRYYVSNERKFFICAQGPHYTMWKRTRGSTGRAKEIYFRYRIGAWLIEMCGNWYPITNLICRIIDRII